MRRLVLASGNPGKLRELQELLDGTDLELTGLDTEVAEDSGTYAGNAARKAEAASVAAGLPALGDDSGLEVAALDGFPGLHSARVAPTQAERERLLFERLAGHPRPWRARFVCVLALAVPGQPTRTFRGVAEGEVVERRRTGVGGFGYDPVFLVPEAGRTFAEMTPDEKHRWSHRGAAVRALLASGALTQGGTSSPLPEPPS
ncbi:MAG TPA: RdgB/HAM1 family non-canonical purine NTP pyrophosphatase [Candidatus Dormibacteraeota bacterium]|nr:RdgB/HAM1 family non-canonical purine NTP pyrophosphatase [Candidatus Dormibacteraeota bacterium]